MSQTRAEGVEVITQIIDEKDKVLRHILTINNGQFIPCLKQYADPKGITTFEVVKRRELSVKGHSHWLRVGYAANATEYNESFNGIAKRASTMGATEHQIAFIFNVSDLMLDFWKNHYPTFREAIRQGKDAYNEQVEMNVLKEIRPNDKNGLRVYGNKPNEMR